MSMENEIQSYVDSQILNKSDNDKRVILMSLDKDFVSLHKVVDAVSTPTNGAVVRSKLKKIVESELAKIPEQEIM